MKKLKFFIALDLKSNTQNINIVKKLYRHVYGFKVGYRSFYNSRSNELISEIKKSKCKLFLDLKLHDIPNTVSSAINSLSNINPDFLTLHISGGREMMKAAVNSIKKNKSDILKTYLQSQTDLTPKINEAIFDRFYDILEKNISDHISIELRNFGVFKLKFMNSRFGSNPKNKNKIYIPSKWKVTFKASENINKKLNEKT